MMKVLSTEPFAFKRTRRFFEAPFTVVKLPPHTMPPSACTAMAYTQLLKPLPMTKPLS